MLVVVGLATRPMNKVVPVLFSLERYLKVLHLCGRICTIVYTVYECLLFSFLKFTLRKNSTFVKAHYYLLL